MGNEGSAVLHTGRCDRRGYQPWRPPGLAHGNFSVQQRWLLECQHSSDGSQGVGGPPISIVRRCIVIRSKIRLCLSEENTAGIRSCIPFDRLNLPGRSESTSCKFRLHARCVRCTEHTKALLCPLVDATTRRGPPKGIDDATAENHTPLRSTASSCALSNRINKHGSHTNLYTGLFSGKLTKFPSFGSFNLVMPSRHDCPMQNLTIDLSRCYEHVGKGA